MRIYIHGMTRMERAAETGAALTAPARARGRRQEGHEMRRHADRAHARPAAAMRDAKGFVQIQMADIRADIPRPAEADLRVHVRAVHVNLPAVRVDDLANFLDAFLEHAVRGGIGHHEAGQVRGMLVRLGAQIRQVDIADPPGNARPPRGTPPWPRWRGSCRARIAGSGRCSAMPWPREAMVMRGSRAARRIRPASRRSVGARPPQSR